MKATMAEKFPLDNRKIRLSRDSDELLEIYRQKSTELWQNRSEEDRAIIGEKISAANMGKKNRLGHKNSEEHRAKASASIKQALAEVDRSGMLWWNDGVINKRSRESPGPNWMRGKMTSNKSYNSEQMREIWRKRKAGELSMPVYRQC